MIQIDIPMPKNCIECPFVVHPKYWNECLFTHEGITTTKRQCKCPLIEVKKAVQKMDSCETCMYQNQPDYCELNNKKLYGFCGNFTILDDADQLPKGGAEE